MRRRRVEERKTERDLALKLINAGYRALAAKTHPDRGGSIDVMAKLNAIRDRLKRAVERNARPHCGAEPAGTVEPGRVSGTGGPGGALDPAPGAGAASVWSGLAGGPSALA